MGLGLRGDIDSAESRLNAYLHAANDEVRTGNATAASRDMDKAEVELSTIEKFLGHEFVLLISLAIFMRSNHRKEFYHHA